MATLIDDATATDYFNGIDNAPEDQRQQMADDLLAWGKAKQAQEYNDTDDHFSKLFTDEAYFEQEKQANAAVQESLDPDQTAKSAAIGAWLEHRNGRPIDPLTYQVERDAYAMANYGKKNLDDAQLFDFISGEYNTQKAKTEAINDLQMQAVGKAITDSQLGQIRPFVDGMTEVFNQWQEKYPELVDGKNDAAFLSQGYKLYYDTINDLETVRPQASKALSTLTSFTQGNANDEDMQSLANDFVSAPPEDRQKIYKYVTLAAQAGQIDRAGLEQFAVNMGQAFTRGFDFVPQGTLQMQEAGVNNWLESIRNGTQIWVPAEGDLSKAVVGNAPAGAESDAWRLASVPETETLIQSGQNVRESFKVVRELRNVAKTGVDPIRPVLEENSFWGTAERGAYGLAGSIPLMGATAVNPYLGVLAYQATEYDRIMLENPDVNPQFAQGLALVEGAANAAIDRVQLSSLSGKLPMFGRYLDRIKSDGIRRTIKIGANVVEQNLQEGAQDLIAPVLETAVASLREDMPDKDFTSLMDEWAGQRAETFFATLPLSLIGGGIATYQDIKNPSAELNATRLRQVGFDKEQTTFIQRAENPEEYDARIQMEWDKRTPENIEAGRQEVIAEMQQAATPDENSAKLSETVAEDGTRRWVVTTPDGKELLQTQDQQAALDAIAQHGHAQILNKQFETLYEPQELRQMITDLSTQWTSEKPVNTLSMESEGMNAQQELEQLQAAGNAAQIQELHNRIANSPLKDTPYEQINILGKASVDDVAEMVFGSLITINPNTRPENLREEIHHTAVKVAIKNGSVTLDTLRGWLDETEKALPGTFQNLVRDSEGDIVESLAQVQAAYENGKINADEETKLPPSFIGYIKNMMRTLAEVMRRAVALRGAFKDGALPAEYESFLADSVGLNQQARVDTARERVSNEVLTDTNYSIGTNPFPMEQKGKWWANEDFEQRGGRISTMSPDQFLSQVRPLEVDDASRDNIDDLKNMMQSGRKLDPLAIYADGKEDGRHRAIAAKELGMDTIPVIDFRANKPEPKGNDFSIGSRTSAVSTDTPSIRASNATITGPANYSIGAFHGTPHKVDKFSTGKIGTGEGAQAYGWGLYFAEERSVGEEYRNALSSYYEVNNRPLMRSSEASDVDLLNAFQDINLMAELVKSKDSLNAGLVADRIERRINQGGVKMQVVSNSLELLKSASPQDIKEGSGNLYTVDLDVEPEDLLDWDKPFSEQSAKVQAALKAVQSDHWLWKDTISGKTGKPVGAAIYKTLTATWPDSEFTRDGIDPKKKASEALLAAGIPGIRYLDGGSRSDGQGTYNYVAFDENLIKITEENGNRIAAADALTSGQTNYSIGSMPEDQRAAETSGQPSRGGSDAEVLKTVLQSIPMQGSGQYSLAIVDGLQGSPFAFRHGDGFVAVVDVSSERMSQSRSQAQRFRLFQQVIGKETLPPNTFIRVTNSKDDYQHIKNGTHRGSQNHGLNDFDTETNPDEGGLSVAYDFEFPAKYAYLVSGEIAKTGTDGEPILAMDSVKVAGPLMQFEKLAEKIKIPSSSVTETNRFYFSNSGKSIPYRFGTVNSQSDLQPIPFNSPAPATGATNYSIGVDSNDSLDYRIADGGSAITASQKIARDLGASSRAIQKAQSSTSPRNAELKAIRDARSIPWEDIGAFGKPDTVASEHQIWFKEGKVFKATAYGRFGHSIQKGPGNALPLEYLRRIAATNEAFDDSARIVGKFEDKDGNLGLIHVQDFIPENPENPTQPTPKQIIQFLESRGFFPAEGRPTNYEVWINPDIGIEVTDLHPGNLIVDATGKLVPIDVIANKYDSTKGVSYSIASQSEIDRVNRALGGMNRGPDERLKVYQRAKQKFSRVMQENKEELDAIRSSVSTNTAPAIEQIEMDRAGRIADIEAEENTEVAKALQDNADTFLPRIEAAPTPAERKRVERDAKDRAKILEQGIRDKYAERKKSTDAEAKSQRDQTLQAAAAKDSAANARMRDKVRQTKLVNAIGELDGILKALPPEVRGRVGGFAVLANIGTGDKALADFFVKRIDMIDRQLERTLKEEYGNVFDALLERTKPKKAAAGEKPKGIGADIQSLFATVREARDWSAEKVDGHIANIETQIASGNLTAQEEAMLTREADLVSLVGDWKNADSSRRAAALSAATETWAKGMSTFVQKKIREREDRDMARAEAISATGKKGDYVGRRKRSAADNGLRGKVHGWFMDTLAWDGVVNMLFGHESPMAIRLSDGQRKAEYAKIDAVAAKEEAIHDLFTKLADGNRAAGEKLMWQMSQPSISANGLNLSELEALSATMLWMQEDGRRHMEGELNENGMPVGKWHYDQKFIDDIESALSPEAKTVRDYLLNSYGKEWFSINSVYREMNGINLPRIQNYSPVTVVPINAPSGMVTDPVTGNSVSATSISPGALRTRGTAIAEPAFRNVVQTYLAHTRQMEHWKAFAPWIKEANGILRFRDVQNSIKEAGGEEATGVLNRYLDAFSQGGNRDASLGLEISQVLNRMASRAAQVALIGRIGTLAIQTTQIGAASAELPMGAYVYRLGKLLTGNLGWGDSLNSAYIQRRLKQMPPIVQIAMEGLKAGKPNQLKHQVEKIGRLISGSDALWTAGTYAMVYDYNLGQAKTLGYTGKAAEDYAHNTAERITDRLAQPTRMGAKSIYEVTATNPGSRLGWAFASEARKNLALLAYTKANRPLKRFGATALGFIVFNLAMGAFIRNAWKDIRDDGDDEDEFFDAKTWNWKRIGVAMATEPLQGIPYLGDYIEKGINAALGQYHQSSDLISFERGVRAIKNIPDIVQGEREMADVLKDIDGMVSLMGLFNQNAAAAASLTHIASDFFGVVDNATTEE